MIRNCGPLIQCVSNPNCKSSWDEMVACEEQGGSFQKCFNILANNGQVPGELVLLGAQCGDSCQRDR
jgi:hypothetical protein